MLKKSITALGAAMALIAAPSIVLAAQEAQHGTAHDFTFESIDGSELPMRQFAGKVVMAVNTASFCGFTKQYEALQSLWTRYQDDGLVVVGVPSNDFGGQEPKSEKEIANFCQGAFGVTFPLTAKTHVTGSNAHPFYKWALKELGPNAAPRWNFHKYLVGRDGRLIASFPTTVKPDASKVIAEIEKSLAQN
jgi:glutathione peroxidase